MKKLLICLFVVFAFSGCGSPDNKTPEAAVTSFVKALISADSKAIQSLNKSRALSWPTDYLLENANKWKMVGSNFSDYEITRTSEDNLDFNVKNKKIGLSVRMSFIFADGRYYFIKCY